MIVNRPLADSKLHYRTVFCFQVGGGLWGGSIASVTGVAGVVAAARDWCPLKDTAQKIAHTAFLALSLVSLAIAQLVVVLASTGLARDLSTTEVNQEYDEVGSLLTSCSLLTPTPFR